MSLASSWAPEEAARHAIEAARAGAKVLVLRNTVTAALATFRFVQEAEGENRLWTVKGTRKDLVLDSTYRRRL